MFREIDLIMLPCNQHKGTIAIRPDGKASLSILTGSPHELYFLSNDIIQIGDWFVLGNVLQSNHKIDKATPENIESVRRIAEIMAAPSFPDQVKTKKIVATTDKLFQEIPCPDGIEGCEVFHGYDLPKPTDLFLGLYVAEYNEKRKIEKVLVEFIQFVAPTLPEITEFVINANPKKDNTITIKLIE